jgi:hypothetical protein
LEETLAFSKNFIGLPYTWGGTSSYGVDCSGFVQMLFKEMGVLLPRNSRDQAKSPLLSPVIFSRQSMFSTQREGWISRLRIKKLEKEAERPPSLCSSSFDCFRNRDEHSLLNLPW